MNSRAALMLLVCLTLSFGASSSGPDLFSITFKPGHPRVSDDLAAAVDDRDRLRRALDRNPPTMRRIRSIQYRVIGRAHPDECADTPCDALARRRAKLFQAALQRAGVPASRFCEPLSLSPPWTGDYRPTADEMALARMASIEPMFAGCAPDALRKPERGHGTTRSIGEASG